MARAVAGFLIVHAAALAAAQPEFCLVHVAPPPGPSLRARLCAALACRPGTCDTVCVSTNASWADFFVPSESKNAVRSVLRHEEYRMDCAAPIVPDIQVLDNNPAAMHAYTLVPVFHPRRLLGNYVTRWRTEAPACTFHQPQGADDTIVLAKCSARDVARLSWLLRATPRRAASLANAWSGASQHVSRRPGSSAALPATLDGTGQVIGVLDTGVSIHSCYFRDPLQPTLPLYDCGATTGAPPASGTLWQERRKVVQYVAGVGRTLGTAPCGDTTDTNGHGTHVAGTLAGLPACDPQACPSSMDAYSGVAYNAKLAVFDAGPTGDGNLLMPYDLRNAIAWAQRAGAKIHSDSYGSDSYGYVSAMDYQLDAACWTDEELVVVVAAGNSGGTAPGYVTSPGLAKNVLTVGASVAAAEARVATFCGSNAPIPSGAACSAIGDTPEFARAGYSGRGGVSIAGRAKPDVMAPGFVVWSASTDSCDPGAATSPNGAADQVVPLSGTSMATPQVAAVAALVRQFFVDGYYPHGTGPLASRAWSRVPSSLVRAVVALAGTAATPDASTGYGIVSLPDVLQNRPRTIGYTGDGVGRTDGVAASPAATVTAQTTVYALCALSGTVRVALAWTDPPLSYGSSTTGTLVNDLDLVVYTLSPLRRASGNGHAGGVADRVSNLEVAELGALTAGDTVYVSVTAARILQAPQRYSLVATGAASQCSLDNEAVGELNITTRAPPVVGPQLLVPDPDLGSTIFSASLSVDVEVGGIGTGSYVLARVAQTEAEATVWCGAAFEPPPLSGLPAGPYVSLASNDTSANVSVLFTAATWYNGRVVWRTQSVWFCAHGSASWVDVTARDCMATQRSEQAVDVRVCGRAAPNGTFVRVDTHDRDWTTACVGDTTGCGCTTDPVDTPRALALVALIVAFILCLAATLEQSDATSLVALAALARYRTVVAITVSAVAVATSLVSSVNRVSTKSRAVLSNIAIGLCALGGVLELSLDAHAPYAESAVAGAAIMASAAAALARAAPDAFQTHKLATAILLGMAGAAAERQPVTFHALLVLCAALFFALLQTTKTLLFGALVVLAALLSFLASVVTPCTY